MTRGARQRRGLDHALRLTAIELGRSRRVAGRPLECLLRVIEGYELAALPEVLGIEKTMVSKYLGVIYRAFGIAGISGIRSVVLEATLRGALDATSR